MTMYDLMTCSAVIIHFELLVCSSLLMTFGKRRLIKRAFVKTAYRLSTDTVMTMFLLMKFEATITLF